MKRPRAVRVWLVVLSVVAVGIGTGCGGAGAVLRVVGRGAGHAAPAVVKPAVHVPPAAFRPAARAGLPEVNPALGHAAGRGGETLIRMSSSDSGAAQNGPANAFNPGGAAGGDGRRKR